MKRFLLYSIMSMLIILHEDTGADDLDIYLTTRIQAPANILFLLDESGSMAWGNEACPELSCFLSDDDPKQRLYQLKKAMNDFYTPLSRKDVNIGIMGFKGTNIQSAPCPAYINEPYHDAITEEPEECFHDLVISRFRMQSVKSDDDDDEYDEDDDDRDSNESKRNFNYALQKLTHKNSTPTTSALHTAINYFKNGALLKSNNGSVTLPSPIDHSCQPNHLVLLSDGLPNTNSWSRNGWGYEYNEWKKTDQHPFGVPCEITEKTVGEGASATETYQDGRCSPDFVEYAFQSDILPDTAEARTYGIQNVITHTIGFHTTPKADQFLRYLAEKGGGSYHEADNADKLTEVLEGILGEVTASIGTGINEAAIPFNPNNIAVSQGYIYVPMFKPEVNPFWRGNLKKYRYRFNSDKQLVVVDAKNNPVSDEHNNIRDDAQSIWSRVPDGDDPLRGGSAEQRSGNRNLYTYLSTLSNSRQLSQHWLYDSRSNRANADIPKSYLGVSKQSKANELLEWFSKGHGFMGGALHTQPVVLSYANSLGGIDDLVLLSTSEGVLSAIDAESGQERWGYIPANLLKNIKTIKTQSQDWSLHDPDAERIYGLDGHLNIMHNDLNGDSIINNGESVTVITGMRRGGKNYYALDLSDPVDPRFKWEITGGSGDFKKLGQTWSRPVAGKMRFDGDVKSVVLFSGGYDPKQDNKDGKRTKDNSGNALFIVDAESGERVWWASASGADLNIENMTNAITADSRVIDTDNDGYLDRVYLADTGGRILRIDFYQQDGLEKSSGYVLADLNDGTSIGNRRFFTSPSIGYYSHGKQHYFAVMAGTSRRPDPMDQTMQNRFYMIRDYNIKTPQTGGQYNVEPATILEQDLYDATANLVQVGSSEEQLNATRALSEKAGWSIDLASGEMTSSDALLYDNTIYFTTYTGSVNPDTNYCEPDRAVITNRFYALNLNTASAVYNEFDGNDLQLTTPDRSVTLDIEGISPGISLFYAGEVGTVDGDTIAINKLYIGAGLETPVSIAYRPLPLWWEEQLNVD